MHTIHRFAEIIFLLNFLVFVTPRSSRSQDFGDDYFRLADYRSLGIGIALQQFQPRGNNSLPDSLRINFNAPLSTIEYRQLNLRVTVGYSTYALNRDQKTEFSISAESSNDLAVNTRRGNYSLFVPIFLSTNYIRAEGIDKNSKEFNVGSFGLGTGLKYRMMENSFGVQVYGVGVLYYSTIGFSIENGTSTGAIAEVDLLFPELFYQGMIVGYRFEIQAWTLSDTRFNYQRTFHGPFIGIFF